MTLDLKKSQTEDYDTDRHIFISISSIKGRLHILNQLFTNTEPIPQHLNRPHLTLIDNMVQRLYSHFNILQDHHTQYYENEYNTQDNQQQKIDSYQVYHNPQSAKKVL